MIAQPRSIKPTASKPANGSSRHRFHARDTAPVLRCVASERASIEAQVGEMVRSLSAGLSQRQIAAATGFNRETVRRYLAGKSAVPAEFLMALCASRGLTCSFVLQPTGHV